MWTPLYLKAYEGVWQPLYFIIQIKFMWTQRNCLWIPFLILITSHAKMKCSVRGLLCRSCASTFRILKRTILWPLLFFPHIDLPIVCACQFSKSRMYVRMYVDDTHLTYTVYLHISAPFMLLKIEICPICTTAKKLILNTTLTELCKIASRQKSNSLSAPSVWKLWYTIKRSQFNNKFSWCLYWRKFIAVWSYRCNIEKNRNSHLGLLQPTKYHSRVISIVRPLL